MKPPCAGPPISEQASFTGKAPVGGGQIQFAWDGMGPLSAVSSSDGSGGTDMHEFAYAPSGMRMRDQRTGTDPHATAFPLVSLCPLAPLTGDSSLSTVSMAQLPSLPQPRVYLQCPGN